MHVFPNHPTAESPENQKSNDREQFDRAEHGKNGHRTSTGKEMGATQSIVAGLGIGCLVKSAVEIGAGKKLVEAVNSCLKVSTDLQPSPLPVGEEILLFRWPKC
jgi:hypothetical protein